MHYAYGVFLLQEQPDKAIEEFKRELELQPEHASSLMQIAYEYLKRGDGRGGAAVGAAGGGRGAATRSPRARRSGRRCSRPATSTARSGSCSVGIKLAPESPGLHFHARARVSARRTAGGRGPRARRVHPARSPGAHAAQRRAVGRGEMSGKWSLKAEATSEGTRRFGVRHSRSSMIDEQRVSALVALGRDSCWPGRDR